MFVTFEQTGKDGEDAKQGVAVTKSFFETNARDIARDKRVVIAAREPYNEEFARFGQV